VAPRGKHGKVLPPGATTDPNFGKKYRYLNRTYPNYPHQAYSPGGKRLARLESDRSIKRAARLGSGGGRMLQQFNLPSTYLAHIRGGGSYKAGYMDSPLWNARTLWAMSKQMQDAQQYSKGQSLYGGTRLGRFAHLMKTTKQRPAMSGRQKLGLAGSMVKGALNAPFAAPMILGKKLWQRGQMFRQDVQSQGGWRAAASNWANKPMGNAGLLGRAARKGVAGAAQFAGGAKSSFGSAFLQKAGIGKNNPLSGLGQVFGHLKNKQVGKAIFGFGKVVGGMAGMGTAAVAMAVLMKVAEGFMAPWQSTLEIFGAIGQVMGIMWLPLVTKINELLIQALPYIMTAATYIGNIFDMLLNMSFEDLWNAISGFLQSLPAKLITVLGESFKFFWLELPIILYNWFVNIDWDQVGQAIKDGFMNIIYGIRDWIIAQGQMIIDAFAGLIGL